MAQLRCWPAISPVLISFPSFRTLLLSMWTDMTASGLALAADSTLQAWRAVRQGSPDVSKKKMFCFACSCLCARGTLDSMGHKLGAPGTSRLHSVMKIRFWDVLCVKSDCGCSAAHGIISLGNIPPFPSHTRKYELPQLGYAYLERVVIAVLMKINLNGRKNRF